ncbi:MAG: WD40 repeat domain-containing protein, partial [Saprospiraceae bacterium]|nr:WD40 repeat domain-containing protein [Saprospiraceae bacterium]
KLAHYYNLRIAPGLADRMASDLIRDDQSHIGPVLQMMLRNMWDTAHAVHPDDVHLTVELYQQFNYGSLAAMLQAQLAKLPPGFKKDMESGKVLDLLRFFTTSQGTAAGRSRTELESRYTDAAQTLALTDALERLFFLQTSTENKSIVRLSHDALAPVIRSLFDKSDAPGQRAARLLEGKFPRDNNWESVNFSETDIEICRLGWRGMPVPDSRLIKALLQSKSEIARTQDNLEKRQKLALRALSISLINASKHALAEQRHSRSFRLAQLAYETFPANNSAIEAMIKSLAAHPAILEFAGHTNGIRDVNISPDGKKIATASVDGLARIWDINGKLLATLEGHTDKLRSILFSPDGNTIVTASHDKTAILWDVSGALLCRLEGHTGPVIRAGFSPDGKRLITASGDATARIWDLNGECLRRLEGHKEAVHVADFSPDGSLILTTSIDYTARIWDAEGQLLHQLAGHKSWVYFGTFSPDGAHILTASVDQTAILWGKDGQRLAILTGHTQTVATARFSPDGRHILTASEDHTARIWDMEGNLLHILQGHANKVIGANFSSDGNYIVTASTDQTAKIWTRDGQLLRTLQGHNGALLDAKFILDDRFVLTYAADGIARIWGARGEQKNRFNGHGEWVNTVEIAPDNRCILTASSDKTARLWTMDGDLLQIFEGHTKEVMTARFSPDGRHVLTASKDNTIRIWTIEGEPVRIISGPPGQFFSAWYSPAGDRIITSSSDKTARVWDLEGNLLLTLEGHKESVVSAQFFADGKRMLTASIDDTIRIWDETGALQKTIATYPVYRAGLSPDESFIVVAHKDGRARFFNLEGKLIQHFIGHNFWVSSARLSPGGEVLVTASLDKTVKVWDAKSGLCYLTLEGHGGAVYDACFFPNEHRVISCSQDQTARIWDLHPDHIVAEADRRGIAFLGTDELREYEIDTIDTSREGFNRVEAILARRNEPLALAFARYYLALSKATPRNNKVHLLRARVLYMYLREKQSVWLTEKEWREVEG